jgi:hypothetical protein
VYTSPGEGTLKVAKMDPSQALEEVGRFLQMWREFFRQMDEGLKAPILTQEIESEFLKLKTRIAARKQVLVNSLGERFGMGDDAMKVMYEAVSLESLRKEMPIRISSLKTQWHEVDIAVNRAIGALKEEVLAAGEKHGGKKRSG